MNEGENGNSVWHFYIFNSETRTLYEFSEQSWKQMFFSLICWAKPLRQFKILNIRQYNQYWWKWTISDQWYYKLYHELCFYNCYVKFMSQIALHMSTQRYPGPLVANPRAAVWCRGEQGGMRSVKRKEEATGEQTSHWTWLVSSPHSASNQLGVSHTGFKQTH